MEDVVELGYAVQRRDWAQVIVTVWPVAPLGVLGMIAIACTCGVTLCIALLASANIGIAVATGWGLYLGWLLLWGAHNCGRRVSQLSVSPVAIIRIRRGVPVESIAVGSISRIYLIAPGLRKIDLSVLRLERIDTGSCPVSEWSVAARSWRLMVESDDGARRCIAGGMTLAVALRVANKICTNMPI